MDKGLMMLLSGSLDALNPCALVTAGIFGLFILFFRDSRYLVRAFAFPLLSSYFAFGLAAQIGLGGAYFSSIPFQLLAIYSYLTLGLIFIGIGIWLLSIRSKVVNNSLKRYVPAFAVKEPAFLRFLGVGLGLALAVPEIYWPKHWWVTVVANDMFLAGKKMDALVGLVWYGLVRLWPMLLMIWVYSSIRRQGVVAAWAAKHVPMIFAVSAACYVGVGIGIVLFFLQKL